MRAKVFMSRQRKEEREKFSYYIVKLKGERKFK
jgi:hypothetical protein